MCMKYNVITDNRPIFLGRAGESGVTTIRFPINIFFPFVNATDYDLSLWHQRDGDLAPYPVNIQIDRNREFVDWPVDLADVANPGNGIAQLTAYVGDTVAKTVIFTTVVADSMGLVDPPAATKAWTDTVSEMARDTANAAASAEQSKDEAEAAAALLANCSAQASTLEPGEPATASYADGVFHFGIPRGEKYNSIYIVLYGGSGAGLLPALEDGKLIFCVKDSTYYPLRSVSGDPSEENFWDYTYSFGLAGSRNYESISYDGQAETWSYSNSTPYSTSNPVMDGVASPGNSADYARGNHIHPTDTSRLAANQGAVNAGKYLRVGGDGSVLPSDDTLPFKVSFTVSGNTVTASATPDDIFDAILLSRVVYGEVVEGASTPGLTPVYNTFLDLVRYSYTGTSLMTPTYLLFQRIAKVAADAMEYFTIEYDSSASPSWTVERTTVPLST